MAGTKKAPGRTKTNQNAISSRESIQTNEKTDDKDAESQEVADLVPARITNQDKPEKVIEVKTEQVKKPKLPLSERKNNTFDVFVKGKLRAISREAYEAVSKDPNLNVSLPKGSPLAINLEPKDKPCIDC